MAYKTKFSGDTDTNISVAKTQAPGVIVEGYFLGTKETPDTMGYGPGKLHVFKTAEGDVGVWGKSRLNAMLTPDIIGQMVLVEFTGMIPSTKKGKSPSYGFKVQHDPANTIEVSADALTQPEAANDYGDADDSSTEEEQLPPVRATRPAAPLKTPDAAQRAKVQAMLSGRKVS